MSNYIQAYLDARKAYEAAKREVYRKRDIVASVASALQTFPAAFMFSNLPSSMPLEVANHRNARTADAKEWPTAEQIQSSLALWHDTRGKMNQAWSRIPIEDRIGLEAPPFKEGEPR